MNAKKIVTVGTAPFIEAAMGKYFQTADGTQYTKRAEVPEGIKAEPYCEVFFQVGLPADLSEEVKAAAFQHSAQRKLQERVSALARQENPDLQGVAETFFLAYYVPIILGESRARAGGGTIALDDNESRALKYLAEGILTKGGTDPKKATKEEKKAAKATATKLRAENHKWWVNALKRVSSQVEKDFPDTE